MSTPISKEANQAAVDLLANRYVPASDDGSLTEFYGERIQRAINASHPPALQWTAERPKVAGWYWCRDVKWPHLKEVRYIEPLALVANQWHEYAGPLPLPSEPQAKET